MAEFIFIHHFWCWLFGHQQPPKLKFIHDAAGVAMMVQACRRCGKTAAEINGA